MRGIYAALIMALLLVSCGCVKRVGPSFVGGLPEDVEGMAAAAAAIITDLYPPGQTSVHLAMPAKLTAFDAALETALRQKGFNVVQNQGALTVAYTVDEITREEEPAWYLQLRLSDGRVFARTFSAGGPEPATTSMETRHE